MITHCQYPLQVDMKPQIICLLDQYQLIEVEGADGEAFLQGQLTTDVVKLPIGHSTLTAHCDPKGKVWSVFRLLRLEQNRFYIIIRKALLPAALIQLKKYAVFSKVNFNTVLNRTLIGFAGKEANLALRHIKMQIPNTETPFTVQKGDWLLYIERARPRWLFITEQAMDLPALEQGSVWDLLDMQDGIPILMEKTHNQFIPQALNLQLLEQAVSFNKGCYIGQEMVARAKYRGANKRALFLLAGQSGGTPEIGQGVEVLLDTHWRKTGTIVHFIEYHGVLWLQVILASDTELSQRFRLSEQQPQPLCLYPLPYTLEDG